MMTRPERDEAAEDDVLYIDRVAGVDVGNAFTVRALAFTAAGHVTHHLEILRERHLGRRLPAAGERPR